jgi:hypothetical protein
MEVEMKRSTSLCLTLLVLSAVVLTSAPVSAAMVGESSSPAFLCSLNQPTASGLAVKGQVPPVLDLATTLNPPCGACSDFACQGTSLNAFCGYTPNHLDKHCYDFGSICSQDGLIQCRCARNVP